MNNSLANQSIVKHNVCAQCYGPLVEKFIDGQFVVVCPKACQPGGFVNAEWALQRQAQSSSELNEVATLYPQFDQRRKYHFTLNDIF